MNREIALFGSRNVKRFLAKHDVQMKLAQHIHPQREIGYARRGRKLCAASQRWLSVQIGDHAVGLDQHRYVIRDHAFERNLRECVQINLLDPFRLPNCRLASCPAYWP